MPGRCSCRRWIFDRGPSFLILQANLLLQALVLMLHQSILTSDTGLVAFAALSGFNYGGILVLYASSAVEKWGSDRIGQIYGWLFSANIPAAVSLIMAGMAYDHSGSFTPVLWGIGGLMICAALSLVRGGRLVADVEI